MSEEQKKLSDGIEAAINAYREVMDKGAEDSVDEDLYRIKEAAEQEKRINSQLLRDYAVLHKVAKDYRGAYRKLLNSRCVKLWLGVRGLLGKKYKPYNAEIPSTVLPIVDPINNDFLNSYGELISSISDSNGSAYYTKSNLRIGIITDLFMYNYYNEAVNLVYINQKNYEEEVASGTLDALFYVSCWHGLNPDDLSKESTEGDFSAKPDNDLAGIDLATAIVRYARNNGVLTIFQSIEDPVSYSRFLPIAQESDYIFTSDANMIARYKSDLGHERVFALGYGINPAIHNPIGFLNKHQLNEAYLQKAVFFAGSWYPAYKNRCENTQLIFDSVKKAAGSRLFIADRNLYKPSHKHFTFPSKYNSSIIPAFDHDELQKVHKLFDYTINLNTVVDSPTMCAMRVYEVQALGSLLLSNYSLSTDLQFPEVFTIGNVDDADRIINGYTEQQVVNMQLSGIRRMYSNYPVQEIVNYIYESMERSKPFEKKDVFVICDTEKKEVLESLDGQTFRDFKVVATEDAATVLEGVTEGFAIRLNSPLAVCTHLEDMVNAFKFVDVDYVCYVDEYKNPFAYNYIEGKPAPAAAMVNLAHSAGLSASQLGFGIVSPKDEPLLSTSGSELAIVVPVGIGDSLFIKNRLLRSIVRHPLRNSLHLYLYPINNDWKVLAEIESNGLNRDGITILPSELDAADLKNLVPENLITFIGARAELSCINLSGVLEYMESASQDAIFMRDSCYADLTVESHTVGKANADDQKGVQVEKITQNFIDEERRRKFCNCVLKKEILSDELFEIASKGIGGFGLFLAAINEDVFTCCCTDEIFAHYYSDLDKLRIPALSVYQEVTSLEKLRVAYLKKYSLVQQVRLEHGQCIVRLLCECLPGVNSSEMNLCSECISAIRELYEDA